VAVHPPRAGISLKSQQLTALFLAIRLYCSFMMEYDVHTLLDALTLAATGWVLWLMRTKLARGYSARKDSVRVEYVLGGATALALVAHPSTKHWLLNRVLWALCVYLEAVSVLPQLRMLQKEPCVERWTANYVFALGIARFLSCAHWVLQVFDGNSFIFTALGTGLWPVMVLLSEVVQTFILGDFCYYYIKSVASGDAVLRLPSLV
jgi:ER lumen protein retaining receptor